MEGLWLITFGLGLILMQFTTHMANFVKFWIEPRLDVDKVVSFFGLIAFTIAAIVAVVISHL